MFQWINHDKPAPEALELEGKLRQLETLEERYAEVQTEYATLQNALGAFKQRYWKRVGSLYARLDELRAEIARLRVRLAPRDPLRQAAVKAATTQARASAEAARDIDADLEYELFEPSEELRKFYRLAAKIVHPDRAGDERDRSLRDEIMSRINVAYRDGHVHTIQALIDEYQMRTQPEEDDAATRLIRTIRLISRVREQIGEISQATASLRESGLYRLYKTVEEAEARGIDKLRVIEAGIERDIERAEAEQERLNQQFIERYSPVIAPAVQEAPGTPRTPMQTIETPPEPAGQTEPAQPELPGLPEVPTGQPMTRQAEIEIAVLLRELDVPFEFRKPLSGSGRPGEREPAFTIMDCKKQPLLWEHLSCTENEDERARWQESLAWYSANGFDAGVNLFVTRDEADGSLDLERLSRVADYVAGMVRDK